jgi:putative ABC transport system permease protein
MFTNYFKLALKVLGRNKFFTFISLFGISFTLMILMLVTAFLNTELGSHEPMSKRDRMVFLSQVAMKKMVTDTIMNVDSTIKNGVTVYDTTYDYSENQNSSSNSSLGFAFLNEQLRNVEGAENQTFYSPNSSFDIFINNNKLTFNGIYADANFWNIFDFTFLEGRAFGQKEVENQALALVISKEAATEYFGKSKGVIGKTVTLEGKNFEVIGVAKTMRGPQGFNPDVIIPYTNMKANQLENENDFQGGFEAIFLAKTKKDKKTIQTEIKKKAAQIIMPNPDEYNVLELNANTFHETYAKRLLYDEDASKSLKKIFWVLISLLLLFVLLPTLNLINLNISRIMERSSEIGVRKAFGASSGNILIQFVFENVILTIIGGFIGFVLAYWLLQTINDSQALGNVILTFNFSVFIYSLIICLFFGVLSGIIPAYRMSKMQIVAALKQ